MVKLKKSMEIIEKIKVRIFDPSYKMSNRVSEKDFTRSRKMPFVNMVIFMLNLVKHTLQKELTHFMSLVSSGVNMSKSAFSQSRIKLKPEAFIDLNNLLVHEFYTDNEFETWNNFRLCAIDSSTINLPISEDNRNTFGIITSVPGSLPIARISSFYDILNGIIIDPVIFPYTNSEYDLALQHLDKTIKKDLILLDRGYGAVWFFHLLSIKGINFVIRLQRNFISEIDSFWESDELTKIIQIDKCPEKSEETMKKLGLEFQPFKIRFVKVFLENGEIEVLATSLLDEVKYHTSLFKNLYFKRWGVEISYDHLKNNIQLENFTGMSSISVKQDFYANTFISNLQAIIARDAQLELNETKKDNKHTYTVNKNLSLGFMKDRVVQILMGNDPNYFEELKKLFKIEPSPTRKGRKFPRIFHRSRRKYHINKKKAI